MSAGMKLPYNDVAIICDEIVNKLTRFCERIEVAGSLRREEKLVGDIELVILPKFTGRAVVEQISLINSLPDVYVEIPRKNLTLLALKEMTELYDGEWFQLCQNNKKDGVRYKKYEVKGFDRWVQVDIFFAVPENFGLIYLLRTGPKDFSKFMLTGSKNRGALPPFYRSEKGYLRQNIDGDDTVIPICNEAELFALTGYQFLDPKLRATWEKDLKIIPQPRENKPKDGWETI